MNFRDILREAVLEASIINNSKNIIRDKEMVDSTIELTSKAKLNRVSRKYLGTLKGNVNDINVNIDYNKDNTNMSDIFDRVDEVYRKH